MTQIATALSSLLPAAGAVALALQGLRRMTRAPDRTRAPPRPQPKEPPAPARTQRVPPPEGSCAGCGTAIPATRTHCAICERARDGAGTSLRRTALHWLVFVVGMAVIIGAGWLLAP